MLEATTLPKSRRVCGVQLSDLVLSGHVAERARARSRRVPLHWPAGEEQASELLEPYADVLTEALNVPPGATPEWIEKNLEADRAPIFAILDCDRLPSRTTRLVVDGLAARFPGVTFVLTTDDADPQLWELYDDVPIAVKAMPRDALFSVQRYVGQLGQLIGDRQSSPRRDAS
jgi:hypothetical protein